MDRYSEFFEKFREIDSSKLDTQVDFVMGYLQDLGNDKEFEIFQRILNDANPKEFNDASVTIALVAWWYGKHLDRGSYIKKAVEYYDELKGVGYGKKIFAGISEGAWKEQFGFERGLFEIKE